MPTSTFSNTTFISIPDSGTSDPYPSIINVSGTSGNLTKLTVTLTNLNHTFTDDIDVLLVSPTGAKSILMSDVGGGSDLINVTLTFDATATSSLSDFDGISSGTYRPTNFDDSDFFNSPAPEGPYNADFSVFNGTNPNGQWRLYIVDDASGDVGNVASGWSISIETEESVINGDDSNNTLEGTIGDNTINGLGGNDTLSGGAGNDTLDGGAGNDLLYGDVASYGGSTLFNYNGNTYLLGTAGTWQQVQAQAQSLGGNLVTINNQAEQDWLVSTFGGSEQLWIGFTDEVTEGEFKWVSGETSTYTNWYPDEPNNAGNEDYVGMNFGGAGKWNDSTSTFSTRGIVEIITGNDTLNGGAGNDTLDGGVGIDALIGGLGDDIYIVDSATDIITENANEGIDTIQSSFTYSIAARPNIENLTLTGTTAINGTGNAGNNII